MSVVRPKALLPGGTIGVVSPAGPINLEGLSALERGMFRLKKLGYEVVPGHYVYSRKGYLAGTDRQRAYDLMRMFSDRRIDAVFCSRGGYGVERIIDYIDFDTIMTNPKIFVGYSNITLLLNLLSQKINMITFHGPMVKEFCTGDRGRNLGTLVKTISCPTDFQGILPITCGKYRTLVPGICCGRLTGGNLSTIISSLGTGFEIDTDEKILFLEDVNEPAYVVDRMLTHLKNAGKFDRCLGIVLGEFTNCENSDGISVEETLRQNLLQLGRPLISGVSAGHGLYNTTLPIGALAELNAVSGTLTIIEPVVS